MCQDPQTLTSSKAGAHLLCRFQDPDTSAGRPQDWMSKFMRVQERDPAQRGRSIRLLLLLPPSPTTVVLFQSLTPGPHIARRGAARRRRPGRKRPPGPLRRGQAGPSRRCGRGQRGHLPAPGRSSAPPGSAWPLQGCSACPASPGRRPRPTAGPRVRFLSGLRSSPVSDSFPGIFEPFNSNLAT